MKILKPPKPKKCNWSKCGKQFTPNPFRFNQQTCDNIVCSLGLVREKQALKDKKELDDKVAKMKLSLKKLSDYEREARAEFQKYIRLRDKNLPCISCNTPITKQWDGGHYLKAELFTGLIFNEKNCHKQCSRCNDLFSGNELEYRDGLIKRYGSDFVTELEGLKDGSRVYKFTKEELVSIRQDYKNKIKEIN